MIQRTWKVERIGMLEEVQLDNGAIRFRASIRDSGRENAFLVRWFNDPTPAADFIDKVENGNYSEEKR
jgi:hypothetical protein